MKPAAFDYVRAGSEAEATALLAAHGEDARPIAGGQSLAPMLAMRLAYPTVLVDLNPAVDMAGIAIGVEAVLIGAMTRQRDLERHAEARDSLPALKRALPWIGHPQTRNRGTVGGSLAHADPAAELPLVATLLNADFHATSATGDRMIEARDFFDDAMTTTLTAGELLSAVSLPIWPDARVGAGFEEVNMRGSDYALVAAAAQIALGPDGRVARAALAIGAVGPKPVRIPAAEAALLGADPTAAAAAAAAAEVPAALQPQADVHATAAYRRRVARALAGRALLQAFAEALA